MTLQTDIVKEARTWLGTRFHHQGRVKGNGCDCIGLLIGVMRDLQIRDANGRLLYEYDNTNYDRQPDGVLLQQSLEKHLQSIAIDEIGQGDVLLFRFDENPQHVGIISNYPNNNDILGIIHCYAQARKVVEHRLDEKWREKIVTAYRLRIY